MQTLCARVSSSSKCLLKKMNLSKGKKCHKVYNRKRPPVQKETVCIISDKKWRRVQNQHQHQHQHRVGQSIINKAESLMTALTCSACALSCLCRGRNAEASDWSQSIVASISNTPSLFPFYCNLHTHSHSLILFCMPRQSHQQRQRQRPRTSMATKKKPFSLFYFFQFAFYSPV